MENLCIILFYQSNNFTCNFIIHYSVIHYTLHVRCMYDIPVCTSFIVCFSTLSPNSCVPSSPNLEVRRGGGSISHGCWAIVPVPVFLFALGITRTYRLVCDFIA